MFTLNTFPKMLCLLLMLALFSSITNTAQEYQQMLIKYRANEEIPIELVEEILSNIETRLQEHNVVLSIEPISEGETISPTAENVYIVMRQVFVGGQMTAIQIVSYVNNSDLINTSSALNPTTALFENIPLTRMHWVDRTIAHILYALGEYEAIEHELEDYINNTETCHIMPHRILGNVAMLEGNYEAAISYFLCTVADYDFPTPNNLIWSYAKLGDLGSAMEYLNTEFQRQHLLEEHLQLLLLRAEVYAINFEYDNAIADMDEVISLAEENELDNHILAELYTIRGEIIFLIYEWDRVEDNFNTAIELDPTYAPAYFQRGILFYTMARREAALADFESYLELDPDGIYAEEAQTNIDSIEIELEALGG